MNLLLGMRMKCKLVGAKTIVNDENKKKIERKGLPVANHISSPEFPERRRCPMKISQNSSSNQLLLPDSHLGWLRFIYYCFSLPK